MKNLKLLSVQGTKKENLQAEAFCLDYDGNTYFGSCSGIYYSKIHSNEVSLCTEFISEIEEVHNVIGMEYLVASDSIFLALSSGDMYLYDVYQRDLSTDCVIQEGINAIAWSPDQELLVLLTGSNSVILMTREFETIAKKNLSADEFGENKPITVGWGSKETQFHGSEGKAAAHVKHLDPKPALPYDDRQPRISWRGDGEFFVTSSIDLQKECRQLRIWNRQAVLLFTSEIKEGLEELVSWRPSGNVIACSQQTANKHKIIFFEKNGLQHGEFVLPVQPNTVRVTNLLWNHDSTVLLVVTEELVESPTHFQVMLWTCSNYHWYLKQTFKMEHTSAHQPLKIVWSLHHPCEAYFFNKRTCVIHQIKWIWCISSKSGGENSDDALVTSIDNENILVTPFDKMVVPPPLCAYSYTLKYPVQSVFFSPVSSSFGCYLGDFKLAFFQKDILNENLEIDGCKLNLLAAGGNGFISQAEPYSFCGIVCLDLLNLKTAAYGLCHWTWIKGSRLLCVCNFKENGRKSTFGVLSIQLPDEFVPDNVLVTRLSCHLECPVIGMCTNFDGSVVAVQLNNGKVLRCDIGDASNSTEFSFTPWLCDNGSELTLPHPCVSMSVLLINNKEYFLGLTERYSLFCNNTVILPNCTSYYIQNEFLLTTTTDHLLKCYIKDHDILYKIQGHSQENVEIQGQSIEKGAKLIISPPGSTKVILQMPRGNLETIHPRPLVLSCICEFLDRLEFGKAFDLAKVHRIDLNILHDHNPVQFLDNIEKIVEQINSSSSLNLILASLKNEDVCETLYPFAYKARQRSTNVEFLKNKIDAVCNAFREFLEKKNDQRFYLTLIATYAKKSDPELDQALIKLKKLKDSSSEKGTQNLVDSALNFLLYLVDVNELIDVALGTYDLEITIMVAQKSQKDPKEFLPFYNDLQKMEENYRKYKIDMHLHRYKQALQHISKCEELSDECMSLIKNQRLYVDSLHLFPSMSDRWKFVWKEYGNYLFQKRHYDEAGLVFTRCEEYEMALLSYKECLNWQLMLCAAANLHYSEDKIVSLCQEISKKLKANQKYLDASYLLEHYVKDTEESIVTLIDGCEWNTALLKISQFRREDITETHLKPALMDHFMYLKTYLEQLAADFNSHTERLKVLRTQKKKVLDLPDIIKCNDEELFSETGSVSDVASSCADSKQLSGSIMTRKSSKSRRKQKLKKYRLKEGSPDEDLAHISALSEIVIKIDNLKDNFLDTLKALVYFGHFELAKSLQQQMCLLVSVVESEIPIIWQSEENACNVSDVKYGPDATSNSVSTSYPSGEKSAVKKLDPELCAPAWRKVELTLQMFV